eukprot:11177010-Lingulodinium_polyedra.AAC.1
MSVLVLPGASQPVDTARLHNDSFKAGASLISPSQSRPDRAAVICSSCMPSCAGPPAASRSCLRTRTVGC